MTSRVLIILYSISQFSAWKFSCFKQISIKFLAGLMSSGLAASDVVRAMVRAGYSRDEIYDLLVESGLKGEHAQLLIERVVVEFHQANIETRPSRIAAELSRLFLDSFNNLREETCARIDLLSLKHDMMRNELEKLRRALIALMQQARVKTGRKQEKPARR